MSRNDWESGEILLPASEWPAFKKAIREAYNKYQTDLLTCAIKAHEVLKQKAKGQRKPNWTTLSWDVSDELQKTLPSHLRQFASEAAWHVVPNTFSGPNDKKPALATPKKKDFPLATSATTTISFGEAQIGFSKDRPLVSWHTGENNRAVERAHEHPVGKAFFDALSRVKWTARTGGELVGNDEYNQDSTYAGGGANYVTSRFGANEEQYKRSFSSGGRPTSRAFFYRS